MKKFLFGFLLGIAVILAVYLFSGYDRRIIGYIVAASFVAAVWFVFYKKFEGRK